LREAYEVASDALPAYSHPFSPQKFTVHQVIAILVLKEFMRCDYRKIEAILEDSPDLCDAIGLKHIPHYTTLQKASARLLNRSKVRRILAATVKRARKKTPHKTPAPRRP